MTASPRRLLALIALLTVLAPAALTACGDDDDGEGGSAQGSGEQAQTAEEPSPSEQREALEDTSTKPVVPKPTGTPPRRVVKEDIVKGRGRPARPGDMLTVNYVGVTFS